MKIQNFRRSLVQNALISVTCLALSAQLIAACGKSTTAPTSGDPGAGAAAGGGQTSGAPGAEGEKAGNTGNTGNTGSGQGTTPPPAMTTEEMCNKAWASHVASNPAGHYEKHEFKMEMMNGTTYSVASKMTQTKKVIESSDTQVITSSKSDMTFPINNSGKETRSTDTKVDFLANCKQFGGNIPTTGEKPDVTLVESSNKTIKVTAGTFDCQYQKMSMKGATANVKETVIESWTKNINNVAMTVKSITESDMTVGETSSKTRTTLELIDYSR